MGSDVVRYLDTSELLEMKEEPRRTRRRAARFVKVVGVLYKRGFAAPYFDASHRKKHLQKSVSSVETNLRKRHWPRRWGG